MIGTSGLQVQKEDDFLGFYSSLIIAAGILFFTSADSLALADDESTTSTSADFTPEQGGVSQADPKEPKKKIDPYLAMGDLSRRIIFYISNRPWLIRDADIDAIVGPPDELYPWTQEKLDALPQKIRLAIYGTVIEKMD